MNHIQQWLQFFQDVSCFFREMFMLPLWRKYPNHSRDIWDSLAVFLEGYAFERQGRRPDFFHAGVDALIYCRQQNNNFNQNVINMIWQHFSQLLNNQGLNPKNNPLYPSTNPNNLRNLNQSYSLIEVVINNNIHQNSTFTSYLHTLITQNQNAQPAFNLVKDIRGIGGKIASFFLRDLVDVMTINLQNVQNRQLLQPIDVWVERSVRILSNNPHLNRQQVANWIVNNSLANNLNPERINMGIWFFCSQIVISEYRLNRILRNFNAAQNLLIDYRNRIRNVCLIC